MDLVIAPGGIVRCIYAELIELAELGTPQISRASHVEPDAYGSWFADLSPADGPRLGPFPRRSIAIRAEVGWLNARLIGEPNYGQ